MSELVHSNESLHEVERSKIQQVEPNENQQSAFGSSFRVPNGSVSSNSLKNVREEIISSSSNASIEAEVPNISQTIGEEYSHAKHALDKLSVVHRMIVDEVISEEQGVGLLLNHKIKFINQLIKKASLRGGYVCGHYVHKVLLPLSEQRKPDTKFGVVSLRFSTHFNFMKAFEGLTFEVLKAEVNFWNEPCYSLVFDLDINVNVTISDTALIKDCNTNQLIARIDENDNITLSSSSSVLSLEDIKQQITDKILKFPRATYEDAVKHREINKIVQERIKRYRLNGWTIDESEALPLSDLDKVD